MISARLQMLFDDGNSMRVCMRACGEVTFIRFMAMYLLYLGSKDNDFRSVNLASYR